MVFPLRPRHEPGEPAHGYVLRLVEANGYTWGGDTLARRGAALADLAAGASLEFAVVHGNAVSDRLAFATPCPVGDGRYRLSGELLNASQIVFGRKRFCAECWMDDRRMGPIDAGPAELAWRAHLRSWWAVAAVAACPIHRVALTEHCFACTRTCTFGRATLTTCRCGADLTRMAGGRVDAESVRGGAYIIGRLGGMPPTDVPVLDGLPLCDALALLQRLGSLADVGSSGGARAVVRKRQAVLVSAGMAIALGGNEGVEAALSTRLDGAETADGLPAALGALYGWFREIPDGSLRRWLSERIAAVAGTHGILWTNWRKHVAVDPTPERITVDQARVLLDLSGQPTRRVLRAAGLFPSDARRRIRPTVDRSAVEAVRRRLDNLLDLPTAAWRLGVTPRSLLKLSRSGIFPASDLGSAAFGNAVFFDPAELDAILSMFASGLAVTDVVPSGTRSLPDASRNMGISKLCRLLLDGGILPCGLRAGERGLKAVLIELDACRTDDVAGPDYLTAAGAACRLGLRGETMAGLLAAGHLRAEIGIAGRRLIHRDAVEKFRNRYVTSSELAQAWGTSTRVVLRRMEGAGIRPAIEFVRSGRIQVRLFERASMPREDSISPKAAAGKRPRYETA